MLSTQVIQNLDTNGILNLDDFRNHHVKTYLRIQRMMRCWQKIMPNDAEPIACLVPAAHIASLLHDIGKLVLAESLKETYSHVIASAHHHQIPLWKAEQEIFHADHGEVGGYLLGLWGLDQRVVNAITHHHHPQRLAPDHPHAGLTAALFIADKPEGAALSCEHQTWLRQVSPAIPLEPWLQEITAPQPLS